MDIGVLGTLTLDHGRTALAPRDRAVLGALVVRAGAAVTREQLALALWGREPPPSWSKVIPGCIMRLRRLVGPARIETTPLGYRLAPESVQVDAVRFETLALRGAELLELGEPDRAAHVLGEALRQWRGQPYPELPDWEPARAAADRLEELRLGAEDALLEARLQSGEVTTAGALARERVTEEPLRERRWVVLALAQYRDGRQADALATVRRGRDLLAAELGLDPCAELASLEQSILRQDESLLGDRVFHAPAVDCPYFGLPPAGIDDAERYFGREDELEQALAQLDRHGVLLVAGSSGVGKSSFVRAGIGASFAARGMPVTIVTPGEHPSRVLRELPDPDDGSLLIVDQCEQAFAGGDAEETARFFDELVRWVFRGLVVVAVRADRLGDLADHEGFTRIIRSHLFMLGPLTKDGLRTVIVEPARHGGLILEPGLVDVLLRDADGRGLPLLSHVLRQVWQRREGRVLTVDGYHASGEIEGAVAQTAEEVFAALDPGGERMLRDILLRLVEASSDGAVTARRIARERITIDDAHAVIVDRLVDARLLTVDEDSLQLSHEALAREWPRLREWLADDIEGQRIIAHLSAAATAWDAMSRPDSEVYRGRRLIAAQQWRDMRDPALTPVEAAFLDASTAFETSELASARRQLVRERRLVRRLLWVSAGAAAFALAAGAAGAVAGVQAGMVAAAATESDARRIAALAVEEVAFDRALLLAVEAVTLWDDPETERSVVRVLSRAPRVTSVTWLPDGVSALALALDDDRSRAAVIDSGADLRLVDLESASQLGVYSPSGRSLVSVAVDPGSGDVAFSEATEQCALARCPFTRTATFDMAGTSGNRLVPFAEWELTADDVEYSPDGSLVAAIARIPQSTPTGVVGVWKVDAAEQAPRLLAVSGGSASSLRPTWRSSAVRFSHDGSILYASGFGPTTAFDTATGRVVAQIPGEGIVAVAAQADRIAVRVDSLGIRVADALGRDEGMTVSLAETPAAAALSPDGTLLAVAIGSEVQLFDAATGERKEVLQVHHGDVTAMEFRRARALVTVGNDGAIVTWDVGDWSEEFRTDSYARAASLVEEDHRTLANDRPGGMTEVVVAEPAAWLARACAVASRSLTREEWAQYLGDRPYDPACTDSPGEASQ